MRHRYRNIANHLQPVFPFKGADPFDSWARRFFKARRLNVFVRYCDAYQSFTEYTGQPVTRIQFKRALFIWCSRKGYQLDPPEHRNAAGRIIRKHEVSLGKSVAAEMLFVKTDVQAK